MAVRYCKNLLDAGGLVAEPNFPRRSQSGPKARSRSIDYPNSLELPEGSKTQNSEFAGVTSTQDWVETR